MVICSAHLYIYLIVLGETHDINHLDDPEKMLGNSSLSNDGREVETELITEAKFITGQCCHQHTYNTKPQIYLVSNESISKHHGIPSIAAVFEQCIGKQSKDIVILCNSLLEVHLTKEGLGVCKRNSQEYIPNLRRFIPSSAQKRDLLNKLSSDSDIILISEYRAFRGCEASHCIIFIDLENPIPGNIMAEMLSRTMVYLDFIVLPRNENTLPTNHSIEKTFDTWRSRGWVETTKVNLQYDYETTIAFELQNSQSTNSKIIEIVKPDSGFIPSESAENQEQNAYL